MIELAVAGATGRMGRCVLECAARDERFHIAAALTTTEDPRCGSTLRVGDVDVAVGDTLNVSCDVLIDFTVAVGTMDWLAICERRKTPMVIAATGHDEGQLARMTEAARAIPVVKTPNCSVGMHAVGRIVGRLAGELGEGYDVEIVETHHRHKVDAPSGTAFTLLDEIQRALGRTGDPNVTFGRHGQVGRRPANQIGVHSLRMGETIGYHEVHFSGFGETITIRHTVHSRDTFAAGALRAAAWVVAQPPGPYSMHDVLG